MAGQGTRVWHKSDGVVDLRSAVVRPCWQQRSLPTHGICTGLNNGVGPHVLYCPLTDAVSGPDDRHPSSRLGHRHQDCGIVPANRWAGDRQRWPKRPTPELRSLRAVSCVRWPGPSCRGDPLRPGETRPADWTPWCAGLPRVRGDRHGARQGGSRCCPRSSARGGSLPAYRQLPRALCPPRQRALSMTVASRTAVRRSRRLVDH